MDRGDISLVSLDPSEGQKQQGRRPVLVESPTSFNRATGVPEVVPITGGGGLARARGFAVPLSARGLRTDGIVRGDQRAGGTLVAEVLPRLSPIFE